MIIGHKENIKQDYNGVFSINEIYSKRIEVFKNKPIGSKYWPKKIIEYGDFPTTGLVAWWPFSGDVLDYSGNNHHLSPTLVTSFPPTFIPGRNGLCLYLYANLLQHANHIDFRFGTGDLTVCFWMRTKLYQGINSTGIFGMKDSDGTSGWMLYNDNNDGKIDARFNLQNNYKTATSVPNTDTWQNWCVTRTSGTMQWYLNGATDTTTTINGDNIADSTSTFYVGLNRTHQISHAFCIDNIIIAKGYAWSAAEVLAFYNLSS